MANKIFNFLFRPICSVAILTLLVSIAVLVTWYITSRDPLNRMPGSDGVAPLGTLVYSDVMAMKIESVREDRVGAPPFTPREGYTFIIPKFAITNITNTTRDLIPTLTLYIKDDHGDIYAMAVAPIENEGFGGPILPHDTVRQEMAFEVKKGATGLALYFESGGKIIAEHLVE